MHVSIRSADVMLCHSATINCCGLVRLSVYHTLCKVMRINKRAIEVLFLNCMLILASRILMHKKMTVSLYDEGS